MPKRPVTPSKSGPRTKKTIVWVTLLTSGLGVAMATFVANKGWELWQHRSVGPKHVDATLRLEDNKLIVFLRNNSDEALDLKRATFSFDDPGLVPGTMLGAYPDVSKVYVATASSGNADLAVVDSRLVVTLQIAQAIAPKQADQFGVTLTGIIGPVDLSKAKVHAEFEDLKGNRYVLTR